MTDIKAQINDRMVGDGAPCFITFEAGATHNGYESALRLIEEAASAKADAVKFQVLDANRLIADPEMLFSYEVTDGVPGNATEKVEEPLYDILSRRRLTADEWQSLKSHADEAGIEFFATAFFADEVDLLINIGCNTIKIASGDINHLPLIRYAAKTGVCIQLDTGNASDREVEQAVRAVRDEGNTNIIVHHCPSGYPAKEDSIRLKMIQGLKQRLEVPIGYSDHSPGQDMDILAVGLGANLLEKTITESRLQRSPEHVMSLEPKEMNAFVKAIRRAELALMEIDTEPDPGFKGLKQIIRRSAFLSQGVEKGQPLTLDALQFRRPGGGLAPDEAEKLVGRLFKSEFGGGRRLLAEDLE